MKHKDKSPTVVRPAPHKLTQEQVVVLEIAVEKLLRLGEQVGVTPDEMITLLDSGMAVRELLNYITSKTARIA
jgi:hypothetical protein